VPVEAGALRADIERYTAPTGQGFDVRQKVPRLIPSSGAVPRRAFEPPGRGSQLPNMSAGGARIRATSVASAAKARRFSARYSW
jgi:hypothetical protein